MGSRTARRALKVLESEGLVAAEGRRGYRVLGRANDPARGCPLAYVVSDPEGSEDAQRGFQQIMLTELQRAAARRRWSLLGVGREGRTPGEIVEHLQAARAGGAVVDTLDGSLLSAIREAGIPAVAANAWREDLELDGVLQDSFTGGVLAARYLVERGHRRIAWVGLGVRGDMSLHVVERFSGAVGGLARAGIRIADEHLVEVPEGAGEGVLAAVRRMLERPGRPTAVLALWQGVAASVARASDQLGLQLGRDVEMVGWSTLEQFASERANLFGLQRCLPAVIWSVRELAEMCIIRLAQRRADPGLPVTKTRVRTVLKVPE